MIRAIFLQNIYVLNLEKNKIDNSSIIIGYAGRYAKQKNILSMLSSFSKLQKKDKTFICTWLEEILA